MNIIDPILFQSRVNPALPALCAPGTALNVVSYGRLGQFIAAVAGRARQSGLKPGMTVAVCCDDMLLHCALILGLTHAGMTTLSLRSGLLPSSVTIAAVISDRPITAPGNSLVLKADQSWLTADDAAVKGASVSDGPCRLILTSGTTGTAKCVGLTHAMIADRLALHNFAFGNLLPRCDRIFCDLGISTSLGFLFLIHALSRGGTLFWRGADASVTMQSFGLYAVEAMIGSPASLSEFLGYYERSPHFGSPFKLIISAGSRLSPQLAKSVRARLCLDLVSLYGSTETSMVATAPTHAIAAHPGAVGFVLPGVSVEIVSDAGEALPFGRQGLVRIRSASMVRGYTGIDQNGPIRDGWFYPGDIGVLGEDGLLSLGGRENWLINLGGDKIDPETLEGLLRAFPGLSDVAVFSDADAMGVEQLRIAIVADTSVSDTAFREYCARFVPAELVPATIARVGRLPRNAMGKLERAALSSPVT